VVCYCGLLVNTFPPCYSRVESGGSLCFFLSFSLSHHVNMVYSQLYLDRLDRDGRVRLARIRRSQFQQILWLDEAARGEIGIIKGIERRSGFHTADAAARERRVDGYIQRIRKLYHEVHGVWLMPDRWSILDAIAFMSIGGDGLPPGPRKTGRLSGIPNGF